MPRFRSIVPAAVLTSMPLRVALGCDLTLAELAPDVQQHDEGDKEQAEDEHSGRATARTDATTAWRGCEASDMRRSQLGCGTPQVAVHRVWGCCQCPSAHLQARRIVGVKAQNPGALPATGWPAARRRLAHRPAPRDSTAGASRACRSTAAWALCECPTSSRWSVARLRSATAQRGAHESLGGRCAGSRWQSPSQRKLKMTCT